MKAKGKKVVVTVITVATVMVILGLYFLMPFSPAGVPQVVDRAKIPDDGSEVILTQVSLGAFKPYVVFLFVHRPDGAWTQFALEEQTINFRGQVSWNATKKVMEIRHYGAAFAYYDPAKEKVVFEDGRKPHGPLSIVTNPMAKQATDGPVSALGVSVAGEGPKVAMKKNKERPADAGVTPDAEPRADAEPSQTASAPPNESTTRPRHGKWSETECRIMEEEVDSQQKMATQCSADSDCCLVWDEVIEDCLAANRSAKVQGYRDGIRALARNCGGNPRRCEGMEPACLFGQCEPREVAGGEAAGTGPHKLGARACPQPYSPSVKSLVFGSSDVVLLTDPRLEPKYGGTLPDAGKVPNPIVEVCVSAEGHVTSARLRKVALEGEGKPWVALLARIESTWRFQPFVVDAKARAFCTNVVFPLPMQK